MPFVSRFIAFLSKLAVICNLCFIASLYFMFVPNNHLPEALMSFVAVMGLAMAPVVSLLFGGCFIYIGIKKLNNPLPQWQTISNLLMLIMQIIYIIV